MMFQDRQDARRQLGHRLMKPQTGGLTNPVVLGLPRGGAVVAAEIAACLRAPLDVLVVRKLGAPLQPELGLGAVTDGERPHVILNHELISAMGIDQEYLDAEIAAQFEEVKRRVAMYRRGRPSIPLAGRTVIVVDDGIATGATVRAGISAVRQSGPARVILAVPVAAMDSLELLRHDVDELVCLHSPPKFSAVGRFYVNFDQISDEQVIALLDEHAEARATQPRANGSHGQSNATR